MSSGKNSLKVLFTSVNLIVPIPLGGLANEPANFDHLTLPNTAAVKLQ